MATFELATPDGATYHVDAPDEATAIHAFNAQTGAAPGGGESSLGFQPTAARTGSRLLDTFDAAMRGAANTATFGLADRLASIMGPGSYSDNLKKERETNAFDRQNNFAASVVGDLGGAAAGFGMLPAKLTAITAPTLAGRMAQGAGQGAILGGAQAGGQSTAEDFSGQVSDAVKGAAIGGVLGGGIGALTKARPATGEPPPAPMAAGNPNTAAVEAAQRAGIDLPAIAATESRPVQQVGQYLADMPYIGTPIQQARETALQQSQQRLAQIAAGMGKSDGVAAGEGVQGAITRYAKETLPAQQKEAYGAIPALKSEMTMPLGETQGAVANMMATRMKAALPSTGGAIDLVTPAITRPGGLTPEGIQSLRRAVGEKAKNAGLNSTMSEAELKQLYGSLSGDYRTAVERAGGQQSVKALQAADLLTKKGKQRIDSLEGLTRGNISAENVTQRLSNMALEGGRGNIKKLLDIKRVANPEEWGNVSASVLEHLGKSGRTGDFSPAYLVSNWDKMSHAGKRALFGGEPAHLQSINDIVTVARALQNLEKNSNKSRSGVVATISGTTAGLMTAPITTLATVLGGRAVASALAKPVTAQSLASYSRAYEKFVSNPTAITLGGVTRRAGVMSELFAKELGIPANDVGRATIGHLRAVAESEAKRKPQDQ